MRMVLFSSVLLLCLAACSGSCSEEPTGQAPAAGATDRSPAPPTISDGFDPAPHARSTTSPDIAVRNLSAGIAGRERASKARPDDRNIVPALVGSLLARSQYLGTFEDLDRALVLGQSAVSRHPEAAWAYDVRADAYQAVHRFDDAEADMARAQALDGGSRDGARSSFWIARGDKLEEAVRLRRAKVDKYPSYSSHTGLAAALGAVGQYGEADEQWRAALAAYRDVSPFPVAFVAFQRGVMWSEQADRPDRGIVLYRQAVDVLPQYVVANVHLAELEWRAGDAVSAEARLRRVLPHTADPEPRGLLAEIIAGRDAAEAATLTETARAGYEDLFVRHPAAFLDHGAEFFMGPGAVPVRALALARANLVVRKNSRAYEVAIDAAEAVGDRAVLCSLAADARRGTPSVVLKKRLEAVGCP